MVVLTIFFKGGNQIMNPFAIVFKTSSYRILVILALAMMLVLLIVATLPADSPVANSLTDVGYYGQGDVQLAGVPPESPDPVPLTPSYPLMGYSWGG